MLLKDVEPKINSGRYHTYKDTFRDYKSLRKNFNHLLVCGQIETNKH